MQGLPGISFIGFAVYVDVLNAKQPAEMEDLFALATVERLASHLHLTYDGKLVVFCHRTESTKE